MTKISRFLTIAGFAGALLTSTAFAQSASSGAMSSMKNEHTGSMMSHGHGKMSSGAMSSGDHMKTSHMKTGHMKMGHTKMSKHGKMKDHHMTSSD